MGKSVPAVPMWLAGPGTFTGQADRLALESGFLSEEAFLVRLRSRAVEAPVGVVTRLVVACPHGLFYCDSGLHAGLLRYGFRAGPV